MSLRFAETPTAALLADGKRLHLQHGPVDLIIDADGRDGEMALAYRQAREAFETILTDLMAEIDVLRMPCSRVSLPPVGAVARHMHAAAMAHSGSYITPMVAVAGAVADHILKALVNGRSLSRAYVNNGGDIALYLAGDARFEIGICSNPQTGEMMGNVSIGSSDPVRGIATSGWRGRSHSLGIADAVTVLACDAVTADAAATMIANAVLPANSPHVRQSPANELSPDSDLGDRPVTIAVGDISDCEISEALGRGQTAAGAMIEQGIINSAFLSLGKQTRTASDRDSVTRRRAYQPQLSKEVIHA